MPRDDAPPCGFVLQRQRDRAGESEPAARRVDELGAEEGGYSGESRGDRLYRHVGVLGPDARAGKARALSPSAAACSVFSVAGGRAQPPATASVSRAVLRARIGLSALMFEALAPA
jgi:hypothetical protein